MDKGLYDKGLELAKEEGYGEGEIEVWAEGYAEGRKNGRDDGWAYYGGYGNKPKGGNSPYEEGYKKGYWHGRDEGFEDRKIYGWQ